MNCIEKLKKHQCRTCYNATKGLKLLTNLTKCGGNDHQKSYAELLREISKINIMEGSHKELPQYICDGCTRKLKAAHTFIKQAQDVNERLMRIIGQVDTNKQLDCLQEAQVDIQSCLEIKMEHDVEGSKEPESQCNVELKIEAPDDSIQTGHLNDDILDINKNDQAIELITLNQISSKPSVAFTESVQNEDIFNMDTLKEDDVSITESKEEDFNKDLSIDEDDFQDKLSDASEWREEKNDSKSKENDKKNIAKSKKTEELVKDANEDVAVPCSQCNKIFNNSKALARHQRTSHIPEDQKCTCPLCFRKFSRSCNMYTHMRTFHGPDTVPLIRKPSTQERIFQCDKCTRNYTKKKHLNIHIKNKHSKESEKEKDDQRSSEEIKASGEETPSPNAQKLSKPKRYEVRSLCSICGSSFSSKTHLIVHMRRHTGERPFKCDLCDRAYPRISELTCHRRIHTGEKPFACKLCGKTFRVSSKMTTHMRSHTDIRPYKCTQCERSFKYSKDLNIHFRIHTGERPYCCNVCGSTFTQSNTLKAHRLKLGHMDVIDNINKLV